jgi:hypothetical protein
MLLSLGTQMTGEASGEPGRPFFGHGRGGRADLRNT